MEIRKIQMEDANNYLDMLLNLDNETKFMMFEPGERPTDINIIKNIIEKSINGDNLILVSIDEENILSKFDTTYNDSKLIKGMKTTSKGFSSYSKVLSEEEINDMLSNTDKLIDKAIDNILEADFEINPKVINGENVSCSFCEYRDICYLREKDKVYINKDGEDNGD